MGDTLVKKYKKSNYSGELALLDENPRALSVMSKREIKGGNASEILVRSKFSEEEQRFERRTMLSRTTRIRCISKARPGASCDED